jgi:AcrR family transcriptional regulator
LCYAAAMPTGLRERKKMQTRREISDIATAMFAQHGFEAVTIAQVAAAAGVAKMTVTNYFPRKEDLVYDRYEEIVSGLARAAAGRAPGESLLTAVRRDYAGAVARCDVTIGVSSPAFPAMVEASPVLRARIREILDQREAALAAVITAEAGSPDPLHAIVAAQLAAVHRTLYFEGSRRCLAGQGMAEVAGALGAAASQAFDLLEPALGGYGTRR